MKAKRDAFKRHQTTTGAPVVSVVMSCYNAAATLELTLRSLQQQTCTNWELILLDDGSTDDTPRIAERFNDPRIHCYCDHSRCGLPYRLNQGITLAQGRFIARMDADDIAFPERLERQVTFLLAHPGVDLVAAASLMFDSDNRPLGILGSAQGHDSICSRPWHGFPMSHPTWMGKAE